MSDRNQHREMRQATIFGAFMMVAAIAIPVGVYISDQITGAAPRTHSSDTVQNKNFWILPFLIR